MFISGGVGAGLGVGVVGLVIWGAGCVMFSGAGKFVARVRGRNNRCNPKITMNIDAIIDM